MKFGNLLIRIGFGLLFVWGGVEKFFVGFLGGVGIKSVTAMLKDTGLGFLGADGVLILAVLLAGLELLAGILLVSN